MCTVLQGNLEREVFIDLVLVIDTADTSDFNSTSLMFTFDSGSVSGSIECNSVGISADDVVENVERFVAELRRNPEDDDAINITRSEAEIFINDSPSDCK